MATLMNGATAGVRSRLTGYTLTAVDKFNAFTRKAWYYIKTKSADGDNMWSEVRARDSRTQYLWCGVDHKTEDPTWFPLAVALALFCICLDLMRDDEIGDRHRDR